jgi:DNA-binding GntR family transcriptional regulator
MVSPVLSPRPRPATLTENAYQQLRTSILDGNFKLGSVTSIVSLASSLGMSRSPVRSAVERLATEGLMQATSGGVLVATLDRHELMDALAVRAPLEGLAARLAAPQFDESALAELADVHASFASAVDNDDPVVARKIDLQFHQLIQSVCGNQCLIEMLERVQARVILATYSTAWSTNQRAAVAEHGRILSALQNQDGDAAQNAATLHLHNLVDRIRLEWKRRDSTGKGVRERVD